MVLPPSVLVFDVNETLLDIDSLVPLFERTFGDSRTMREWFAQLVMYSMAATLSGCYVDYFTLGHGVLRMLADIRGVDITADDAHDLRRGMSTMPAHPDVEFALAVLRDNGFRLVTLTNSPVRPGAVSPLDHAGLGSFFERQFSVDTYRAFKTAPAAYRGVCRELGVAPADCMMVAAHAWDTIGAQAAGFSAALITRRGNAPLPVDDLPRPTLIAADLRHLTRQLCTT